MLDVPVRQVVAKLGWRELAQLCKCLYNFRFAVRAFTDTLEQCLVGDDCKVSSLVR